MAKVALADVLWDAANVHLSPVPGYWDVIGEYSCNAVLKAEFGQLLDSLLRGRERSKATPFLVSLGCDAEGGCAWLTFEKQERQGVRYMWLLLAMHVAEDEGIEIEVTQ